MATITISTDTLSSEPDWRASQEISAVAETEETPPLHAINIAPRWNESKTSIWRISATLWCGLIMGANDAAYGAIIPYVCTTSTRPFHAVFILTTSTSYIARALL